MAVSDDTEALNSLRMALKMKQSSRYEKAKILMQHAMALKPNHPEILNHYAELLEGENIIEADRLYAKALVLSPGHYRAVANRLRTAPVVEAMDQQELDRIDKKMEDLLNLDLNTPTLKALAKEVYFQHIHHTLAIEGNTMSLEETKTVAENGTSIPGKSIREHDEVIGFQSALAYMESLVGSTTCCTIQNIRQIHKRVLDRIDPLEAGSFRKEQIYVGVHVPPPATEVEALTENFIDWLRSEEAMALHPVKRAALAHHRIAYIHPFLDGNGRTARLVMNFILMSVGFPSVIIRKQDKSYYFDTLQMATEGDERPLVRFLAHCTECILDVYLSYNNTHYNSEGCLRALETVMAGPINVITL